MDRRTFLAAMAAGAIVTAEGLWVPGQKLISIPKKQFITVTNHGWGTATIWTSNTIHTLEVGKSMVFPANRELLANHPLQMIS